MTENSKTVFVSGNNGFKELSILTVRKLFMVVIVYFLKSIFKQKFEIPNNLLQLITAKAY